MNVIDAAVGQRIKQRRKVLGLSQTDLADRIGVKFQQVQKYESGANRVAASRLWEISEALDVPVTYFFQDVERRSARPANMQHIPGSGKRNLKADESPSRQKSPPLSQTSAFQNENDAE